MAFDEGRTQQFDFRLVQQALREGTAKQQYPIGSVLPDLVDKVSSPLRIVDYREVYLANGQRRLAAILLRERPVCKGIAFDGYTHNNRGERIYGSRYDYSMVRQWLNYAGDDQNWWHPRRKGDVATLDYYAPSYRIHGYLHYCSEALREAISPIQVDTILFDDDGHQSGVCSTSDWAFLPSCEDLCIDIGNEIDLAQVAWRWFSRPGTRTVFDGSSGARYYASDDAVITCGSDYRRLLAYYAYANSYEGGRELPCWTRSSKPLFSSGHLYRIEVYKIRHNGNADTTNPTNRYFTFPAHAIVG